PATSDCASAATRSRAERTARHRRSCARRARDAEESAGGRRWPAALRRRSFERPARSTAADYPPVTGLRLVAVLRRGATRRLFAALSLPALFALGTSSSAGSRRPRSRRE